MRTFLAVVTVTGMFLLASVVFPQAKPDLGDVLKHRYGNTAEWVIRGDQVVAWKTVTAEGSDGAADIPQPTAEQIKGWLKDPLLVKSIKATNLDPHWRALIAAMCAMTECDDEDAAWAAFLAALP